jgi:hypothetical protein
MLDNVIDDLRKVAVPQKQTQRMMRAENAESEEDEEDEA